MGFLIALALLSSGLSQKEEASTSWSETESRLANHYIKLLQKEPAYGKVFDLLWDLYQKHDQIELLLGYFQKASDSEENQGGIATLLYAHLVRKNGDAAEAEKFYHLVLKNNGENVPATKALAEISDQKKDFEKALSYYQKLTTPISIESEDGVAIRLRIAALQKQSGNSSEAVNTWNNLLKAYPVNRILRAEILAMLLEAGETESAISVLKDLAKSSGPREKLESLIELNRLYEFISDFDNAVTTAREGMALLHFKDHQHNELFMRLVSAHERFDHLDSLESDLKSDADRDNPSERDLYLLADFYRLTANPRSEEDAIAQLVQKLPADVDYRVRLAEIQMANDRYEAAADTLDEVLKDQTEIPLRLVLLRAKVAVTDENEVVAEETLTNYLDQNPDNPDITKKVIEFARTYYLDRLVEKLLREGQVDGVSGSDGESAPVELARFLKERGQNEQSSEILLAYVNTAKAETMERARRLHQVAVAFREIELPQEAASSIEKALEIAPKNIQYLTTKANIEIDAKKIALAIATLQTVWDFETDIGKKTDIDQRIFTLLRGHYSKTKVDPDAKLLKGGTIQSLSEYRKMAAAVNRSKSGVDDGPPQELIDYYRDIKNRATKTPSLATHFRAAWWAHKLQETGDLLAQLSAAQKMAGKPVIEIENIYLQFFRMKKRPDLVAKQLKLLAEIDPGNSEDYLQKRALIRFQMGYEDEATRALRAMISKPDASLSTINTLAKVYKLQGSTTKHIEIWRSAFRRANLFEKRSIIKQLSSALIESKNPEGALKVQLELIEKENDPVQRHKQLDSQIATAKGHFLLDWLQDQFSALAQKEPFDRFFPEALARVQLAAGKEKEAFTSMKKAYYMSGQDSDLLDELGDLASRVGDLKSAIYYRRQIIAKAGDETSIGNWRSLIEMLEKDLRVNEADLLRKRLETKFGQDPEFLTTLTKYYRENNRFSAAERVLKKLVGLRSWDIHAKFELALLKSENGQDREAAELFADIIDRTKDATVPGSQKDRPLWPIVRVLRPGTEDLPEDQLRDMAISVEGYPPGTNPNQTEALADWLQLPHPEFSYLPRDEYFVRLRAIEEYGTIYSQGKLTDNAEAEWRKRWTHTDDTLSSDKLWVLRYSNIRGAFGEYLTSNLRLLKSDQIIDRAWCCYSMLISGTADELLKWSSRGALSDRAHLSAMMAFLLLRDQAPREPFYDQAVVMNFLSDLNIGLRQGVHIFSELRDDALADQALDVGKLISDTNEIDDGNFSFQISQMARVAGKDDEREIWLNQAIDRMLSNAKRPGELFPALTEKLSLMSSDAERRRYADIKKQQIIENVTAPDEVNLEKLMMLDFALGDNQSGLSYLKKLSRHKLGVINTERVVVGLDNRAQNQSKNWAAMNNFLSQTSNQASLKNKEETGAFIQALGNGNTFVAENGKPDNEFDVFELERLTWKLEWQNHAERLATVKEIYSSVANPASLLALARVLQDRGYQSEAAFVFHSLTRASEQGYTSYNGMFEAFHESMEPETALKMISQLNEREIPIPPGLTVDYLNEQRARFLFHSRDIERLVQLGKAPDVSPGSPPITTRTHLPFQYALIRAYLQSGDDEGLLQFLSELRDSHELDKSHLLIGARLLRKKGEYVEAIKWIDDISFNGTLSNIERDALAEMVQIQEASEEPDKKALVDYTQRSLGTQPVSVSLLLVSALHRSGASQEAEGILRLLYRRTKNLKHRDDIAIQLLKTRLEDGISWEDSGDELEIYLRGIQRKSMRAPTELVGLFVQFPPGDLEAIRTNLLASGSQSNQNWVAPLLIAFLEDTLPEEASKLAETVPIETLEHLLETLIAFGEVGKNTAARIVDTKSMPGGHFFRNQPERQISFYSAIGDLTRLREVHSGLMRESESALFKMQSLGPLFPALKNRYQIPSLFADAGYADLAGSLYRKYHDGIVAYRWNHSKFLEDYVRYLIEGNHLSEAEQILARVSQKSIRFDFRVFMELYDQWGKLDEWEDRTATFHLSTGEQHLLREWRTALAEGREMVEYDPSWE